MSVQFLDCMGSDVDVANAARVSYNKQVDQCDDRDVKLIHYLASHGHWTPFAHCIAKFRIRCNLAVAAQLKRHQVGLAVNEMSRRYVAGNPEFDVPYVWRASSKTRKQGSGKDLPVAVQETVRSIVDEQLKTAENAYQELLDLGVAPEQARFILPVATETQYIWTGSLFAFSRVCQLRLSDDAQPETADIARAINDMLADRFPVSWNALMQYAPHVGTNNV